MSSTLNSEKVIAQFEHYLERVFLKNLALILVFGGAFLSYYIYSEWSVRHDLTAVAIRVIPMAIILVLLIVHLVYRHRFSRLKNTLYLGVYLALQLMMYAKCLLHLNDSALAPSVTGAILVIFLISSDMKQNVKVAAFIFGFPVLVFTFLLVFVAKPTANEVLIIADIYPILIIGFIINRVQYNLRFKLFKSNKLLLNEQNKTKALYSESLIMNSQLKQKALEAELIKEEIEKKNVELQKLNDAKDKFLGIIAHDLKNPIGNICGFSEVLLSDNSLNEKEKHQCLELIHTSILHTHRLLENLLDWARAQSHTIGFFPSLHDAHEVVEKEIKGFRHMADKKGISVENAISHDLKVFADLNMFETIIRNIAVNAIKFTPNNGKIVIDAQLVQKEGKFFIEVSVTDNGVGMESDQLAKLFKISEHISTRGTENEEGTGLGLLLCKEFMDIHKGFLSVTSKLGEGSVFKCLFPLN